MMAGYLLHQGATVLCMHSGQAQPAVTNPRVKVGGQAIVTLSSTYTISGCPNVVGTASVPCVSGQWMSAATKLMASGEPVLLQDSSAVCTPTGAGLNVVQTQTRVRGQ
jgi:hypothetical protein